MSKKKEGLKVKRVILRKRTTGASKKVTQSSTYGKNTTIREYVSRKWNQVKKEPLVKPHATYERVRRKKKEGKKKNSGIQKSNSEESTNAECAMRQTAKNKGPG